MNYTVKSSNSTVYEEMQKAEWYRQENKLVPNEFPELVLTNEFWFVRIFSILA